MLNLILLGIPPASRDSLGGQETADTMIQGASLVILFVSLASWYVGWRLFKIEREGKIIWFCNFILAVMYVPFLVVHFFNCWEQQFRTGKEHYLMLFFVHALVLVLWSLGFNGRRRQDSY